MNYKNILFISIFCTGLFSFTLIEKNKVITDFNDCIKKVGSEWGAVCKDCVEYKNNKRVYDDTYTAFLVNTCSEKLEVKLAFQEQDLSWRCFPPKIINPNDTLSGFACKSNKGKYLKWVRKSGDHEIVFPTDKEINEQYK